MGSTYELSDPENFSILISTDNHLGCHEKDPERGTVHIKYLSNLHQYCILYRIILYLKISYLNIFNLFNMLLESNSFLC